MAAEVESVDLCNHTWDRSLCISELATEAWFEPFWYTSRLTCVSQTLIRKTETYTGYFQKKRPNAGWQRLTKPLGEEWKIMKSAFGIQEMRKSRNFRKHSSVTPGACIQVTGDRCRSSPGSLTLVFQESFEMCPLLLQEGVRSNSLLPLNLA